MSIPVALRGDFDAAGLRRLARVSKDANQARRLLALATIYAGGTRSAAAEVGGVGLQIVRDWVMRFNADGPAGLLDRKAPGQPALLNLAHRRALATMIETGPIPPSMASCAGGWSIWRSGSGKSSRSRSRRRPWAASCVRWATASSRPGPAIMRKTPTPRSLLKSAPHPPGGDRSRQGRGQAHRDLVRRRGPDRPEEQDHATLGAARHATLGAARSAYPIHLHLRRHLPGRRQGRRLGPALLQHRGDEPASCRDLPGRRR